jgi:hypothetical protein
MDVLRSYLLQRAVLRKWSMHPDVITTESEVERLEECMK